MSATFGILPVADEPEFRPGNLEAKFVAPPFSVLDTRQGYWQDRRRAWLSLGIKSEIGRGDDLLSLSPAEGARQRWASRTDDGRSLEPGKGNHRTDYGAYQTGPARAFSEDLMRGEGTSGAGTSIFDPVLCELIYRWFAPEGGAVLDPFAGGSVRGIVAAKLGHPYTGIDLSARQLDANREQARAILEPGDPMPVWRNGDSAHIPDLLAASEEYDLVFSCPPYFDLEVYSSDPSDLSNMPSWPAFITAYGDIIGKALALLRPNRFACFVVSEIRGPDGFFRGLVPYTIHQFAMYGARFYNEAILVNSAGSLPLRVGKYMDSSRKLGRSHQNVLVFVKGDPPGRDEWSYERVAPPAPQLGLGL